MSGKYDYSKLRGKIVEKYRTIGEFADAYGITRQQMTNKLTNRSAFSVGDIEKIRNLLGIGRNEIYQYFFTRDV